MYKIVGADQKEYGPVTLEQVKEWIREGRANRQTLTRFQDGPWKPLSTFPEFADDLQSATPPPPPPATAAVPPQYGSTYAPSYPTEQKPNNLAITGLICSILGLFCCGVLAPVGLIFSIVGLVQINQQPERYTGKGIAIAGIVLAAVAIVVYIILASTGIIDEIYRNLLEDSNMRQL